MLTPYVIWFYCTNKLITPLGLETSKATIAALNQQCFPESLLVQSGVN